MKKKMQNKLYIIFIALIVFVCLFPINIVFAAPAEGTGENDQGGTAADSQKVINIPDDIPQAEHATWMSAYYSGHAGKQKQIQDLWKQQGEKRDEHNWAYIEIGGQKLFLVALAEYTFGDAGDYVDVYVKHNGQEKVYNCILGDTKRYD